jgi:hypothetical protein
MQSEALETVAELICSLCIRLYADSECDRITLTPTCKDGTRYEIIIREVKENDPET